jgi:ABC-type spermidine/putrescine transport system permease subunit I
MRPARRRLAEWLLTAPSLLWLAVFFALPTGLILTAAFRPTDLHGGLGSGWSLDAVRAVADPSLLPLAWRTLWLSATATGACLLLALPVGCCVARLPRQRQGWVLLLIVLPFLTNFLIRVFAWKSLLHPDGALTRGLQNCGWLAADGMLLYRDGAVLAVLVYVHLPFAILPVYAAAEKFDFGLLEAARDLGAGPWRAFWRVLVPGVRGGITAGALLVFTGCLGQYVVPQLVGGTDQEMIGNRIVQRVFSDRNLPEAAALAGLLLVALLFTLLAQAWHRRRTEREVEA